MSFQITLHDVVKHYKTVDITLPNCVISDRVTILQGPNGSGKSTLLKALLGWIHYDGQITTNATFAYMPEHPSFPQDITVHTFLQTLHPEFKNYSGLLDRFQLTHKQSSVIQQLSKGMKAKLNIIQCMAMERDIYLLDEPFNGLDYDGVNQLISFIQTSTKRFIITTHIKAIQAQLQATVITLD